jgi:tRNA(adenine34) deaminase
VLGAAGDTQPDPAADLHYMGLAIQQARRGAALGEVPVGAVLVRPGASQPVAAAHNQPIGLCDPSAHAELLALRQGAQALGNYRLDDCTLYVTLEPCAMCAQAMLHARLRRLVYGAPEPKTGAAGSVLDLFAIAALNHHTAVQGGVRADECAALLQDFFAQRRSQARATQQPLRPDALRTPEAAFEPVWQLFPQWRAHQRWVADLPALGGLRLHLLDLPGARPAAPAWLLLHGPSGWWPQWAGSMAALQAQASRVLVPDLIGFGQSDKPKRAHWHSLAQHAQVLHQLLQHSGGLPTGAAAPLQLRYAPGQAALAQALAQALLAATGQVVAALELEPAPCQQLPANWHTLPYPDAGHRAALHLRG